MNHTDRLALMLNRLHKDGILNTTDIAKELNISPKVARTDILEYIIPMFNNIITYSHQTKSYVAQIGFLHSQPFNIHDLATIAILKNYSKSKYCDANFRHTVDEMFNNYMQILTKTIYEKSQIESIKLDMHSLNTINSAINNRHILTFSYNQKHRTTKPIKIVNLESYWYLIAYDFEKSDYVNFYLNDIVKVKIEHERFDVDKDMAIKYENAITAFFKPLSEPFLVILETTKDIAKYFNRKKLNKTQQVMQNSDLTYTITIKITHYMEILPTIQRYLPYIIVREPKELKDIILKNITTYIKEN